MKPQDLQQIGPYPVVRFIAEGGMSWLFEVEDPRFNVSRALKMLKPSAVAGHELQRFESEAKLLAHVDHPNVITIYDFGRDEATDFHYYTMTYVDGPPLSQRGELSAGEVCKIFLDVLSGLSELHQAGVTHRDVKPANIMLAKDGRAVLIDLGIARQPRQPDWTDVGLTLGTALYMSPEQAKGQPVGASSDVFSAGLAFYRVLAGRSVYDGVDEVDPTRPVDILNFISSLPATGAELAFSFPSDVRPAVRDVIAKACRVEQSHRYPDASAMHAALESALAVPENAMSGTAVAGGEGEVTRRLMAVLFSDIVNYTGTMGEDEEFAIKTVQQSRTVQKRLVEKYGGNWLQEFGDGVLCSFESTVAAVGCALEIQNSLRKFPDFDVRIGIHVGDLAFRKTSTGRDIYGDAVNVASRIEALGRPGEVYISERVYDDLRNHKNVEARFVGEKHLKNVNRPIRVYSVRDREAEAPMSPRRVGRRQLLMVGALAVALAAAATFAILVDWGDPPNPPVLPRPHSFDAVRAELLAATGPFAQAQPRIWAEPNPVPDGEIYTIRIEAQCDCSAVLFSVGPNSDGIQLLHPLPGEPMVRLEPGRSRFIPTSSAYVLRAEGVGTETLALFVVGREVDFPSLLLEPWSVVPGQSERLQELEDFLAALSAEDWAAAQVELETSARSLRGTAAPNS